MLGGGSTVPVRQVPGVHAQDDTAAKEGSCAATVVCHTHNLHHRRIEGTPQDEYIILVFLSFIF